MAFSRAQVALPGRMNRARPPGQKSGQGGSRQGLAAAETDLLAAEPALDGERRQQVRWHWVCTWGAGLHLITLLVPLGAVSWCTQHIPSILISHHLYFN